MVDVRRNGVATEGEENVALGLGGVKPDCRERRGNGEILRHTRRAAGNRHALHVQRQRQPFAF